MGIKLKEAIHVGMILIIAMLAAGICPAQGANVELVSHLGGDNYDVVVAGNYTYLGQGQDLVVLNVTDDTKPLETGRTVTPSVVYGIALSGNYAYAANGNSGLTILDITNASSPKITGSNATGGIAYGVEVSENHAYVIGSNGLSIMDISNSSSPELVGSYGTYEMSSIKVSGDHAYAISKGDLDGEDYYSLLIVNVTDPAAPTLTGSYDIGEGGSVAVAGNYAYVSSGSGILIVDITDSTAPVFAGTYDSGDLISDIAVSGDHAYLTGYSLSILDIADPAAPALVGSYDIGDAQDVAVAGDHAYVINSMDGSSTGLLIVDITDPAAPISTGIYSTTHNAYDIAASGNYAYVADYNNGLITVNLADPSTPRLEGSIGTEGHAYDIAIAGNYAYIANSGLTILNITDPALPEVESSYYNASGDAAGVAVAGNYAYVASVFGGLLIVNVTDPAAPTFAGSYVTDDAQSVDISGNYAYIANGFSGLFILDITDPAAPTFVGSYDTSGYTNDVAVAGNYACIADGSNGLVILNITTPTSPKLASTYDTVGYANDITISEDRTYVAASDSGLVIADISDPTAPTLIGNYTIENAFGVALSGENVLVADYNNGLYVLHMTEPQDTTPPASVTKLKEGSVGSSWIRWTWTNPTDADFSHAMIYIDGTFVTNTSSKSVSFYNATGLPDGDTYTVSILTVDSSGNINSTWVNDSATTVKFPQISGLSGINITTSSITLIWQASNDTTNVEISQNDIILTTVNGSTSYVDSDLSNGTTYNYTLVPSNKDGLEGKAVSISLSTSSPSSSGGGGGSSTTQSSTSGGGGGAGSVEDYENVALKDVANAYLIMDASATYEFTREGNPIESISFYSLKNSGEITSTIEVLNNRSKLVNSNPEGFVYKYINIWVGKSGFATEANIKDPRIKFKIASSWIQDMGVSPAEIRLQRYNGNTWDILPTTLVSSSADHMVFESQTPGFSPFAITAGGIPGPITVDEDSKLQATSSNEFLNDPLETGNAGLDKTKPEKIRTWTLILVFLVAGIFATGYEYLKKQRN
ncbi:PGF-pre-PGF domain-containing protein [Methanomethylovorans sp.]|uniref:PGF-pre-PGF domain-containing protein n=1 Tax=Methanomethylovorans sp. TaxID=2758717 RepID=UPI00351C8D5F